MAAVAGPSPIIAVPLTAMQQVDPVRRGDRTETPRAIEPLEEAARGKASEENRSSQPEETANSKLKRALTEIEQQQVQELAARDREVRQHELAHQASVGRHGGSLKLEYTVGPDGRRYAVAGSVQVDLSREASAEETLEKAEQIKRAALAPADPSNQDRMVAQQAAMMAMAARAELLRESREQSVAQDDSQVSEDDRTDETKSQEKEAREKSYQQRFDQLTETLLILERYRDDIDDISERIDALA